MMSWWWSHCARAFSPSVSFLSLLSTSLLLYFFSLSLFFLTPLPSLSLLLLAFPLSYAHIRTQKAEITRVMPYHRHAFTELKYTEYRYAPNPLVTNSFCEQQTWCCRCSFCGGRHILKQNIRKKHKTSSFEPFIVFYLAVIYKPI